MSGARWLSNLKRRLRPAPQRRRGPDRPAAPDGVPVTPDNPPSLSGGAAAALSFDG